jgi:hypothetical protein
MFGDEATVRCAARGRQLGFDAGFSGDGLQRRVDQSAAAGEEGPGAECPGDVVVQACAVEDVAHRRLQLLAGAGRTKAKVELDIDAAWNDIAGAGAAVDVGDLPGGRREKLVAPIPDRLRQLGNRRGCEMDWVAGQMRVGDVALHALDGQFPRQRSAAPIFDHVAERVDRGRLADDAVVDRLAALAQGLGDGDRAVDGVAFLIGSKQEGDRAAVLGLGGDEGFGGGDESCQRSFHVGGAAPVQHPLLAQRLEGIAVPLFERAAGDDVGMTGQTEQRTAAAAARPEVADRAALDELAAEADGFETAGDDRQAAGVVGGQRATGDELLGECKRRLVDDCQLAVLGHFGTAVPVHCARLTRLARQRRGD